MRELKFRAWSNTAFVYFDLREDNDFAYFDFYSSCESNDIEQYTGLKDKNGKEIYEGDILQDVDGDTATVIWRVPQAEWGIRWSINKAEDSLSHRMFWGGLKEVIGNIHENPELLEAKNVD